MKDIWAARYGAGPVDVAYKVLLEVGAGRVARCWTVLITKHMIGVVQVGTTELDCAGQPRAAWNNLTGVPDQPAAVTVARNGHGPKGLGHYKYDRR